jgi:RecA/RadA recombinase
MISTGSTAMDSLLGGAIHTGIVTDIYGESGSGKSQLCFTLCANCAKDDREVVFVDTVGTFRPERIIEIGSRNALEKITLIRALTTLDQTNAINKIQDIYPRLLVIDTLTSLFSAEYSGPARHLAIMNYLHRLALLAIDLDCAVVVTNMIRYVPVLAMDQAGRKASQAAIPWQQREYLGRSISIYSHMRLKLEIMDAASSLFKAALIQPAGKDPVQFTISAQGISDTN